MSPPANAELRRSAVIDFAHALVVAAITRLLHEPKHRLVQDAINDLLAALRRAEATGVDMPLTLQFDDDRMHHDGATLDGPSLQARTLLRRLADRQIATLSFAPQLRATELNRLFDLVFDERNRDALTRSNRDATLRAFGLRHVRVSLRTPADPGDRTCDLRTRALHGYQDLADCLQQNHLRAYRDLELAVDATNDAVERTLRSFEEPSLLLSLATHDDVDRFTVGHSVRVALLALQVAREIGASRDQLVHVGTAALMHDIGKSKVPQEVLFKQGRLSDEEWALMAQHPRLGAQLLLEQGERIDARTIGAAFCHHMGPSGLGYPQPLLPTAPSGTSNLVRVCDVFEALTAVRPYKHALTPIEAYAVMFRSEQDFDSAWLRMFARVLGLFPIGSRVLLRDGSHGMVVAQTSRPDRPVVQLLAGPDGADLPADHPGKVTIGQPFEGRVPVLHSVTLNDRCLPLPELDCKDDMVHRCVHGACLPSAAPAPGGTR